MLSGPAATRSCLSKAKDALQGGIEAALRLQSASGQIAPALARPPAGIKRLREVPLSDLSRGVAPAHGCRSMACR
jgi:hypothetical protein